MSRIAIVVPRRKAAAEAALPFAEFLRFTRAHEWHAGKLPILLGFVLSLSVGRTDSFRPSRLAVCYVLFCLFLACAYMLNNVSDLRADSQAGKTLELSRWAPRAKMIAALAVGAAALIVGAGALPAPAFFTLLVCFALAWAYSFRPRFKESPAFGPAAAAVGQLPGPAFVALVAWGEFSATAVAYLALMLFYGLRMILVHQLLDMDNDIRTGTRTTATVLGRSKTRRLVTAQFVLELALSAMLLALLVGRGMPPALLLLLAAPLLSLCVRFASGTPICLDSYEYIPLADLHESLLPLMIAVTLCVESGGGLWWLPPMLLLLFLRRHRERLLPPLYLLREG